ncbi:DISARM system phospholipase D-like protein DrmC [Desulfovibrio piger]|uniref:DISARM system phospholipase D-like protein DrmC n=2 Tax=Desulfovibrio TaxID=872 RepID=UPI0026E99575|nr:DISARM system phospholipase D-like protein DrmC [Desulfovibrio piger]
MPDTLLQDIYTFCSRIPLPLAKKLIALLRRDSSLWHAPASCKQQCGLNSELAALFQKLVRQSSSAKELAITLETGSFFIHKNQERNSRFVWSGPAHVLPDARKTEQVLLDLIQTAQQQILLVSFAAYKIPPLLHALEQALARGVQIRFILENKNDSAGQLSHSADKAFETLKDAAFYHWPLEKRPRNKSGNPAKMHAKCAISESAFLITSANLTQDAIDHNIELGILHRDREKAASLIRQFENLIIKSILQPY